MAGPKKQNGGISIEPVQQGSLDVCILGRTPLLLNRMSEKAKRELLLPARKKNSAEKATTLKHDPISEMRAAAHQLSDPSAETLLAMPASAFKSAMRGAALDQRGATKAQMGRLCYVRGEYVGLFGQPQLHMAIVRQAGPSRTPDVRSRVVLAKWAVRLQVDFVEPILTPHIVNTLLEAAGFTQGVGDWRPEKGAGNYGQFGVVAPEHPEFAAIVNGWGREAQRAAMETPTCYDAETEELFSWFEAELGERSSLRRVA